MGAIPETETPLSAEQLNDLSEAVLYKREETSTEASEDEYGMEESKLETKNDMREGEKMMEEAIESKESKFN